MHFVWPVGHKANIRARMPHFYVTLFQIATKCREWRNCSESQPFPAPWRQHRTEINRWGSGRCRLPWGTATAPPAVPGDKRPWGAVHQLPEECPPRALPGSGSAAPGDRGDRAAGLGQQGGLSPVGIAPAPGVAQSADSQRPTRFGGPSTLISSSLGAQRRLQPQTLLGGTVAVSPSLLTLQLEADATGLGPGQAGGGRWGPPIPLSLAGAPRAQELALLAEKVDGRRAAVGAFAQHGPGGSLGGMGQRRRLQLSQVGDVALGQELRDTGSLSRWPRPSHAPTAPVGSAIVPCSPSLSPVPPTVPGTGCGTS